MSAGIYALEIDLPMDGPIYKAIKVIGEHAGKSGDISPQHFDTVALGLLVAGICRILPPDLAAHVEAEFILRS
jgi:hypothetical protein